MYKPSLLFERTPEERRDKFKSWNRSDQAFFASGACHILADLFVVQHQHEGFKMIYIQPGADFPGIHVYASDGVWAFDHNGWTKEVDLLRITETAYTNAYPGWTYTRHVIKPALTALEDFCKTNDHLLPWQFAYLPWERADTYIKQFPEKPVV